MNNKLLFYMFLLGGLVTIVGLKTYSFFTMHNDTHPPQFNIAIITLESSYHTLATNGFIKSVERYNQNKDIFNLDIFTTKGHDRVLTTSISNAILSRPFDLVITVGAAQSAIFCSVNKKRDTKIPQICIGAGNLVNAGIITSNEKPGGNVTGISGTPIDPLLTFDIFHSLKPHAKKILLPYCPHSSHGEVEQNALIIVEESRKYNVAITLLPFEEINEAFSKIRYSIKDFDTIFCLEGDVIDDAQSGIGKLCSEHNVTFFAGTLGSVKESAAAGFGVDPELSGKEAFEYTQQILINGENPGDLPIKFVDNSRRIAINKKLCAEQDLPISPLIELYLSRGVVY